MAQINSLRPISQRLNSTPVEDLPRYAGFIASSILALSDSFRSSSHQKDETSLQVHKLTTRVTSLLQDRSQEGRFTGIVLVQALVESAGLSILEGSGSTWVRSLLSCLNKPDPPEVKKLAILSITRIFILTKPYPSLVREVTTPNLPAFITTCLACIKPATSTKENLNKLLRSRLLEPVLQCWNQLIKAFPSTFRPFVPNVKSVIFDLLSDQATSQHVAEAASAVFALLHFCAPKDAVVSDWTDSCRIVIESAHEVADSIFRSILEEWSTVTSRQTSLKTGKRVYSQPHSQATNTIKMSGWSGVRAGTHRAKLLMNLLSTLLDTQHAQPVRIPIAQVLDLTARFATVIRPTQNFALRENKEISRDEREELFMNLTDVHCAVIELHQMLSMTFKRSLLPVSSTIFSQIFDIFESGLADERIRINTYQAVTNMLQHGSVWLSTRNSDQIATLARTCCSDLMAFIEKDNPKSPNATDSNNGALAIEKIQKLPGTESSLANLQYPPISQSACELLLAILSYLPSNLLSSSTRAKIDRTIILMNHKHAMLASVINPPQSQHSDGQAASILPFLSRLSDYDMAFEALMRPRRPVVRHEIHVPAEDLSDSADTEIEPMAMSSMINTNNSLTTPSGQLEGELFDQLHAEVPMPKKREYANTQDDDTSNNTEYSKKARIGSDGLTDEEHTPGDVFEEENKAATDVSSKAEFESQTISLEADAEFVADTHSISKPVVVSTSTQSRGKTNMAEQSQEYESDDSEIPQIDATLSSDEEDEDEDEEMQD